MVQLFSFILILLINIVTTEYVAKRKFNRYKTYFIIILYSLIIIVFLRNILPLIFIDSVPSILIILFSWTYLLIFIYLYENKLHTLIIIMAFSFSHTLLVNGLVYHYFMITSGHNDQYAFLWTQVVIFLISTPIIIFFIKQTLKKVLASIDYLLFKTAVFVPILNFIVIYILRFLIDFDSIYTLLIFYISMIMMIMASYYFIYRIISTSSYNKVLTNLVYTDHLTKLKNRMALYKDFKEISQQESPYILYYMDLNRFKDINDQFGHMNGDYYLVQFSEALRKTFKTRVGVYRISGDEFIVITLREEVSIETTKKDINHHFHYNQPFFGVSIGYAEFPTEGNNLDALLNIADQRMYDDKNNKDI
ncbi:MAG: GGDEF domain-containing protein [Tenericutes bacterium]|jgi:diguanylate cyclase (GGDEF)-like protein|nr:GGDEF domain-containing protein [Mycoplasmatota bacterium]